MMPTPNEPANCCVILKIELTSVDFSFATKVEALAIVLEKAAKAQPHYDEKYHYG